MRPLNDPRLESQMTLLCCLLLLAASGCWATPHTNTLLAEAEGIRHWVVGLRRQLHRVPELGWHEQKTAAAVTAVLTELGIPYEQGVAGTGVVGHLGTGPGPVVMLRADMDGLPIQEPEGLDFQSQHPGAMHACGHDGHMAMLLGAARLLKAREQLGQVHGRVKLVLQPFEEGGAGADKMVKHGVLEGVQAAFGLHVMPFLPSGVFASRPGTIMAGALSFHINITGRGGHAAMPHLNVDPVVAAAAVITALQTLVSRETSPLGSAVLSVTLLRAGDSYNVIPDVAQLGGTIRALDHEAMMRLQSRVGSLSEGVAQGYGCSAEVDWRQDQQPYYPPTVNDAAVERVTQQMAAKLLGADKVVQVEPIMPAEDFSFYCQQVPCTFGFLGIRNETLGSVHNLHSPQFLLDESVLHKGAALHAAWALTYLDLLNAEALEASGSGQAPDAPNGLAARDEL
ncbi:hypothetical protein V8C86DRAFT_2714039 [Haematococcus lacustris]